MYYSIEVVYVIHVWILITTLPKRDRVMTALTPFIDLERRTTLVEPRSHNT